MDPRFKSDLLWGAVGALSFLVLLQGYHAVRGEFVDLAAVVAVTAGVFLATAATAHVLRPQFARWNERT